MKKVSSNIVCAGMDVHYKFSNVTFRNSSGNLFSLHICDTSFI
jgi:hypothetical protein